MRDEHAFLTLQYHLGLRYFETVGVQRASTLHVYDNIQQSLIAGEYVIAKSGRMVEFLTNGIGRHVIFDPSRGLALDEDRTDQTGLVTSRTVNGFLRRFLGILHRRG
jgi:hypothetical protein